MRLDPRDRGLAYGDGVFETLRITAAGEAPLWPRHLARLQAGLQALGIPAPAPSCLQGALASAIGALAGRQGVVKMTVTRGVGGRGYLPPSRVTPTLFVQHGDLPQWSRAQREQGIELGVCQTVLHPDLLAGYKHLNRLPQVQARREVARYGWDEGLLLSPRQQPLEATSMNLFVRFEDHWWTPDLARAGAGVAGVMRDVLQEKLVAQGMQVCSDLRPLSQLRHAEALFLCNSVVGVLPVRKLAQWHWPVTAELAALQAQAEQLFHQ